MTTENNQPNAAGSTNEPAGGEAAGANGQPVVPAGSEGSGADASKAEGQSQQSGKPAGEGGEADPDNKGAAPVVPEKYEVQLPDGVDLDAEAFGEFSTVAKDLKLSNEAAQKLTDVVVKMQQKQAETFAKTVKGWVDQSKADKEIGGDAFDENLATARKAREHFGSEELNTYLDATGLGNHPGMIKMLFKVGQLLKETQFHSGGERGALPESSLAKRLYPNMNP